MVCHGTLGLWLHSYLYMILLMSAMHRHLELRTAYNLQEERKKEKESACIPSDEVPRWIGRHLRRRKRRAMLSYGKYLDKILLRNAADFVV